MAKRYLIQVLLTVLLWTTQEEARATQSQGNTMSVEQKEKERKENAEKERLKNKEALQKVEPTLQQTLDPSEPWGVNLDLVDKRIVIARKMPGGAGDFSSHISMYQTLKARAKDFGKQKIALMKQLDKLNSSKKSFSLLKVFTKPKTKEEIQNEMNEIDGKIDTNMKKMQIALQAIIDSTKSETNPKGLTHGQVIQLPDMDSWKVMKQQKAKKGNKGNKGKILPNAINNFTDNLPID